LKELERKEKKEQKLNETARETRAITLREVDVGGLKITRRCLP